MAYEVGYLFTRTDGAQIHKTFTGATEAECDKKANKYLSDESFYYTEKVKREVNNNYSEE